MTKTVEFYKKGDFMIRRNKYLNLLISNRDNGFPKVITGIRRCGKSYLLKDKGSCKLLFRQMGKS